MIGDDTTGGFACADSREDQDRILYILRLLRPYEQVGLQKIRVGRENDGGCVMVGDLDDIDAAFSPGINNDVSWDKQMADRGIEIFQFDHTIDPLPEARPRFHWSRTGICGVGGEPQGFRSLPDIIHTNPELQGDLILKMDIEGAEWSVLATMPSEIMTGFRRIVCEFHGFQHVDEEDFFRNMLAAYRNMAKTHRVVHVHANNAASAIVGGVPVPTYIEMTLLCVERNAFKVSDESFPTTLDQSCWPGRADYKLGQFIF